jgi:hypothetical protein
MHPAASTETTATALLRGGAMGEFMLRSFAVG